MNEQKLFIRTMAVLITIFTLLCVMVQCVKAQTYITTTETAYYEKEIDRWGMSYNAIQYKEQITKFIVIQGDVMYCTSKYGDNVYSILSIDDDPWGPTYNIVDPLGNKLYVRLQVHGVPQPMIVFDTNEGIDLSNPRPGSYSVNYISHTSNPLK